MVRPQMSSTSAMQPGTYRNRERVGKGPNLVDEFVSAYGLVDGLKHQLMSFETATTSPSTHDGGCGGGYNDDTHTRGIAVSSATPGDFM